MRLNINKGLSFLSVPERIVVDTLFEERQSRTVVLSHFCSSEWKVLAATLKEKIERLKLAEFKVLPKTVSLKRWVPVKDLDKQPLLCFSAHCSLSFNPFRI